MATKKTTTLRRCAGSTRFGIEPHEAPVAEFPKQPSRKDGLGTMCTEHWRAYVKGLREARRGDGGAPKAATMPPAKRASSAERENAKAVARVERQRKRTIAAGRTPARASEAAAAEALIAEVDALPADQHVKRVGQADVQAALETSAATRMLAD